MTSAVRSNAGGASQSRPHKRSSTRSARRAQVSACHRTSRCNSMRDSDPVATFAYGARELSRRGIAYLPRGRGTAGTRIRFRGDRACIPTSVPPSTTS